MKERRKSAAATASSTTAQSSLKLLKLYQARARIVWCAALHITQCVRGRVATLRNGS